MNNTFVQYKKNNHGLATVTLSRPEKHNAFDENIIESLQDIFHGIKHDVSVRAVVLAAEGKSFSAGADLNWMKRMASYSYEDNRKDAQALAEMLSSLNTLPQPTVARVQGAAFGGALGLIACCDIAFASDRAKFCLSEVKLGLIPAVISPYIIEAIGVRAARRYFLSAETFTADQALRLGLLSEVVEERTLDNSVDNYVEGLLRSGPVAMREAKKLIFDVAGAKIDETLIKDTSNRIATIRVSEEGQEGLSAFLEKRLPHWQEDSDGKPVSKKYSGSRKNHDEKETHHD